MSENKRNDENIKDDAIQEGPAMYPEDQMSSDMFKESVVILKVPKMSPESVETQKVPGVSLERVNIQEALCVYLEDDDLQEVPEEEEFEVQESLYIGEALFKEIQLISSASD